MLTAREIKQYRQDGYVIPSGFRFDDAVVEALRAAVETILASNPKMKPDRIINPHLNEGRPYGVKGHQIINTVAHDRRILEMLESVMGPDIILWLTHLFCKLPQSTREVPWHQDGQYWPIRPWATCTVWIAIDRVEKSNGAMKVIPGSHEGQAWQQHVDYGHHLTLSKVSGVSH